MSKTGLCACRVSKIIKSQKSSNRKISSGVFNTHWLDEMRFNTGIQTPFPQLGFPRHCGGSPKQEK